LETIEGKNNITKNLIIRKMRWKKKKKNEFLSTRGNINLISTNIRGWKVLNVDA